MTNEQITAKVLAVTLFLGLITNLAGVETETLAFENEDFNQDSSSLEKQTTSQLQN